MARYDHALIEQLRTRGLGAGVYEFVAGLEGSTPGLVKKSHTAWRKRQEARKLKLGEVELQRFLRQAGLV
jgi:hypothetical protein